ncbi:MAG TPA: ATP-binding cassette domain-containing protein [Ensifer sp.]|nr:ATP-binding cassette domain-containing protein [Ensifer sp.]
MLLEDIAFDIAPGTCLALVGQNGSGKSTLLKLLAGQVVSPRGDIRFEGKALRDWDGRSFARRLAYLPQHLPDTSGLLVRELVAMGRYPWHGALGTFGEADRRKVSEAIEQVQLGSLADRLVDTLSGGERQRAWLAMLVAQDADCLLLDEPTSALDIGHQLEVLSLVRHLSRKRGLTVISVLHDINMAARFFDEIIGLRSGRMIACGTPTEIMTSDNLERIYGVPMEVITHGPGGQRLALAS